MIPILQSMKLRRWLLARRRDNVFFPTTPHPGDTEGKAEGAPCKRPAPAQDPRRCRAPQVLESDRPAQDPSSDSPEPWAGELLTSLSSKLLI